MEIPSYEELLAHLEAGTLPPELRRRAARTPELSARLATAERLLSVLGEAALEPVSERLLDLARAVDRRARTDSREVADTGLERVARGVGRVRQLVASLVSAPEGGVLAFRGTAAAPHLAFRAEPFDVDVSLLDTGSVVGQVLPDPEISEGGDGGSASLPPLEEGSAVLYGGTRPEHCQLDEDGGFLFRGAGFPPSDSPSYLLVVDWDQLRLVVPEIDFGTGRRADSWPDGPAAPRRRAGADAPFQQAERSPARPVA
jgi:hypothetical protein